jgi:hypothetical protein
MKRYTLVLGSAFLGLALGSATNPAELSAAPGMVGPQSSGTLSIESGQALLDQYCVYCHDDVEKSGGMSLSGLDLAHVEDSAELAETMVRKLRAGMMPPAGAPRPDAAILTALAESLEYGLDTVAAANPNPGGRALQRLNRAEYARSIRELLEIDVDVAGLLPPDVMGQGFDNTAEALSVSAVLVQGYMRAASQISRVAVGDPRATPGSATFKIPRTASQMRHVEGAPFGTRGGMVQVHNFPANGDYVFNLTLYGTAAGRIFGLNNPLFDDGAVSKGELEVSVNGERVALLEVNRSMSESSSGLTLTTEPIFIEAGPQKVAATFVQKFSGMVDDLVAPIEHTQADGEIATGSGITALPHLQDLNITGPFRATGVSYTPSRARIFTCRPTLPSEEMSCAAEIISNLASEAYRKAVSAEDLEGLMNFYVEGRDGGDFESGVRMALQAVLASPSFVFRFEAEPDSVQPGQDYRISDLELASRLSYFLWSTVPDDALIEVAEEGRLHEPTVLEQQVRRMIKDPRAETLSTRFAAQWLHLADLTGVVPDPLLYPQFDTTMGESMRRETELLFDSIVREDRNLIELLTADYTFVDERLAKHYGISEVMGYRFQRVPVTDENRLGLLGHGSILTITSTADRTSPVQRGKWVMEVLLGTPPPNPPPNVPELAETARLTSGKVLTVRERMEEHRANPTCAACHRMMDPIGLALENFDPTGRWRTLDGGSVINPTTELFDGTHVNGPASLRHAILARSEAFIRNFIENLMSYGLGRRVEYYDMPTVRVIARAAAENDNRISSFILGVVRSPAFQMKRAAGGTTVEAGGQRQ